MEKLSTSDKWELLGALYKHGSNDRLLNSLNWNEETVQKAIRSFRLRAERRLKSSAKNNTKEDPIDLWHDFIHNCHQIEGTGKPKAQNSRTYGQRTHENYTCLLSKSFLYAACFEEHYQGQNPEEPNYNEIYRYLSQLLAGEEPIQLRPGNARKVLEMMSKLKNLLDDKESVQRYQNYIAHQHKVSYLEPDVDVWAVVEENKNKRSEVQMSEVSKLFKDPDNDDTSLADLDPEDPQYEAKKDNISLKLSLKQRALASLLLNVRGMNPLEVVLPSLVKPPSTLLTPPKGSATAPVPQKTNTKKRKRKTEH